MKSLFLPLLMVLGTGAVAQNITFNEKELYPESLDFYAKDKCYYVSSLHYGKIGKVNSKGEYKLFVDDKDLPSAIGLRIDKYHNQLLVCASDPGVSVKTKPSQQGKFAKLAIYDLENGSRKAFIDLGKLNKTGDKNFANDIALSPDGKYAYVTNSFAPIVYKVDLMSYKAEVFVQDPRFSADGFGLNGIACLNNGYVIVVNSSKGELYRIDPKNTKDIVKTTVDADLKGGDGLVSNGKGELVIISNAQQKIYKLTSNDNFGNATVSTTADATNTFPTTGYLLKSGKYLVLNAKLNEIFTPGTTLTSDYLIQEVF